jgi:multicomponent K+:H+ antiporter subunit E
MKRLLGHISPVVVLSLLGLWLLLNQSLAPAQIVLGVVLAVVLAWTTASLRPVKAHVRRLDTAVLLILVVIKDIVQNNLSVARIVLGSRPLRDVRSGFLRIPLDLRDPHGLAALAAIVTATPGTVWAGLSTEGHTLTLHVLDLDDEAGLTRLIKDRYEKPLMRIFE